jgi:hypothetical protein
VQDAFRAAAEKIGRRGRREAVDQPLPLPPPPQYLESARYWSAQPGPSDAGDPPPAQGSYLALAPTATPWPASPNLPSATSWGDVATGIEPQRSGLGGAIARTWDNPTAPVAGQITLPLIGAPSLIGLLKSLWSGATLPGDVLAAKVDPLSDEGIARSGDLALMGRLSAANQPGTLGLGTMRGATLKNFTRPQVGRTLKDIPPHLTDDEAREAINAYRWEKLGPDLFGQKEEKGVVAVTKGEGRNEFGVNSGLPTYEERAAADRLRDKLLEKYPELNKQDKIGYNTGWMPNDASIMRKQASCCDSLVRMAARSPAANLRCMSIKKCALAAERCCHISDWSSATPRSPLWTTPVGGSSCGTASC